MPGTLFVVATPIGNLEDITARALRVLSEVAVIAAEDTRRTAHLLTRFAITTPTTSFHEHNEGKKAGALIARLQAGESVALVSDAGTPTISDPGQGLIREAIEAGIRVEAIPGPNAAIAALSASGLSGETFTFLGFPPTGSKDRKEWFSKLRSAAPTVVFYEAPHRIRETLEQLMLIVGDRRIAVGRELTKAHEELVRGPISSVLGQLGEPRGEFTVVLDIGQKTDIVPAELPAGVVLLTEVGELTENRKYTKRVAINALARKYQRSPNDVYAAVEKAKKSVK
jgi:16S rRNA (cytidine1402-2'-O)-methyltransferase